MLVATEKVRQKWVNLKFTNEFCVRLCDRLMTHRMRP